jgi:predicted  nucleic acid-binding Zn-ribbon protein
MKGAIAGGVIAALVVCALIVLAATLVVRRRQRKYPLPASYTPTLSSRRSNAAAAAATRSIYAKARESQLEQEMYALKEQMDTLKRYTMSVQLDNQPRLAVGDVEREMMMLKRQMDNIREEMGELRVEREALRGLGCGSDISCRSDSF